MKQAIIKMTVILSVIVLSACAEMNSTFDCPMKPGVRCESIDLINERVERGELGKSITPSYQDKMLNDPDNTMRIWIAPYTDQEGNHHTGHYIYAKS